MNNRTGKPRKLTHIALQVFEDREGSAWILNRQTGWVRLDGNARSVVLARKLRTLGRFWKAHRQSVQSIAGRLPGGGASLAMAGG